MEDINPRIVYCMHINKDNCPPYGTSHEYRRVKWYEIELILWGEGSIITEGKRIPANKGNLFFRKPGMVVQGISPYFCYLVIFDISYEKSRMDLYSDQKYFNCNVQSCLPYETTDFENLSGFDLPHCMTVQQNMRFEELFLAIYNQFISTGISNQFFLKTYLMQILMLAYSEWSTAKIIQNPRRSIRANYPKILEVKKYIDNNIHSRFMLRELAELADLSPNFFCKIFRDIIGEGLIEYINTGKMSMAKKALLTTNKVVKEISYDCGFENDTYFYTLFKKKEGLTPSEYREKNRMLFQFKG